MWDQRYAQDGFSYGTEPNDHLVAFADRIPPGPVLCLAEGEGRNAVYLASRGHAVTAVDQSAVGLSKAAALAAERGLYIATEHADLADYTIEAGVWAGIVSVWCHVPPQIRLRLHRGVVDGLAPGGVFILEAYTPDQLGRGTGGPPSAGPMMTAAALREELEGLELVVIEERLRDVQEGRYHTGMSAVVQVVARRPA